MVRGGHYLSSDKISHVSKHVSEGNHSHQLLRSLIISRNFDCIILSESDTRKAMSKDDTAPESTLPYPPVYKDKKFVVLTDW